MLFNWLLRCFKSELELRVAMSFVIFTKMSCISNRTLGIPRNLPVIFGYLAFAAVTAVVGCNISDRRSDEMSERVKSMQRRIESVLSNPTDAADTAKELSLFTNNIEKELEDVVASTLVRKFANSVLRNDIPLLVSFAISDEGISTRWLVAEVLIVLSLYDEATTVLLSYIILNPENRSYKVWKWWEHCSTEYGDKSPSIADFVDALLRKYKNGDIRTRLAIADILGVEQTAAFLSVDELKAKINYDNIKKASTRR